VAVYSGGVDKRIAAVISSSGWGNGENKFRMQHNEPGAYASFLAMLEQGRAHRARTGQSMMVPRYEIVPIPAHLRERLVPGSLQMFTAETAQSMFDFRAEDVIGAIAPRPCLLLHAAQDSVTPTQQSIDMFARAGQPTDLHLFADADHFLFAENNARVRGVVCAWLADYFPAQKS
jgi:pimeloyl-ACP methyl ester carboxylesterase